MFVFDELLRRLKREKKDFVSDLGDDQVFLLWWPDMMGDLE